MKKLIIIALLVALTQSVLSENKNEWSKGDWIFKIAEENKTILTVVAKTYSDTGSSLGHMCVSVLDKCFSFFSTKKMSCVNNAVISAIVNVDGGGKVVKLTCFVSPNHYSFVFETSDVNFMKKYKNIGIAFPLESGKFQAFYFSLDGSELMINLLEAKWRSFKNPTKHTDGMI